MLPITTPGEQVASARTNLFPQDAPVCGIERLIGVVIGANVNQTNTDIAVPLLLLAMGLLRPEPDPAREARGLDFFYSLLSFQLAMMLVLGTAVATAASHTGYFQALLITVFVVALALLMLNADAATQAGTAEGRASLEASLAAHLDSVTATLSTMTWANRKTRRSSKRSARTPPSTVKLSGGSAVAAWTQAMQAHVSQVSARSYVELQLARAQALGMRAGVTHAQALFPNEPLVFESLAQTRRGARSF